MTLPKPGFLAHYQSSFKGRVSPSLQVYLCFPLYSYLVIGWACHSSFKGENSWFYKHYTFDFASSLVSSNWNWLHETHRFSRLCEKGFRHVLGLHIGHCYLSTSLFKRKWLSCPHFLFYMTMQSWVKGLKVVTKSTYNPKRSPNREYIFNEKGTKISIIGKKNHHSN